MSKNKNYNYKPLESWIWDTDCVIRGAQDAEKYKYKKNKNIILLINASKDFQERQLRIFIPEENQSKIVDAYFNWKEIDKKLKNIFRKLGY